MKRLLVSFITLSLSFLWITTLNAEVQNPPKIPDVPFPSWTVSQSDNYVEGLKKENELLSAEDIKRVEDSLKSAKEKKDWGRVATEYAHLAGKNPDQIDNWIQLSFALQKQNQERKDYNSFANAQSAAYYAYQLAKKNQDIENQAIALLLYGNTISPEEGYESGWYLTLLQAVKDRVDIEALKKRHPELQDLMAFKFIKVRVNNQTSSPSACLEFSHPLETKTSQYRDFLDITPKVDVDITAKNREVCISPLKFGENYDIIVKPGISSTLGEKINTDTKLSFKVKDQNSRLSFTNKAYVLMRDEVAKIPLTSVNVDSVKLKVLMVTDRALNQIFNSNSDFLKPLWDYRVDEIENTQGVLLWQGEMDLGGSKNETQTKQVPFSDIIKETKPGVYVVQAEEKGALYGDKARATQWLIISDLGLTTLSSEDSGITVNVRSLSTAEPVSDVEVQLIAANNTILSKAKSRKGMVSFDNSLTRGTGGNRPRLILAYGPKGDFSFIDLQQPAFDLSDRGVEGRTIQGLFNAFLYTEQGVYRPGSTVHLNTLLRDNLGAAKGDLPLTFVVLRPDAVEVARSTIKGNAIGFYELPIEIPASGRTGQWTVQAYLDPNKSPVGEVHFSVEDFVPSRMLVSLKTDQTLLTPTQPVQVQVKARYLFGANASGLSGTAQMILKEQEIPYPDYKEFTFGLSEETFMDTRTDLALPALNPEGESTVTVTLEKVPETSKALVADIRVTIDNKGGRPEMGSLKVPVRIKPLMIGIKPLFQSGVVSEEDDKASFEIIAVNNDGKMQSVDNLEYELVQEELHYTWYQAESYSPWQYKTMTEDKFLSKGATSAKLDAPNKLEVALKDWGRYRLEIRDPKTGAVTSIRFSKGWVEATRGEDTPDKLNIKTDKDAYEMDDTVQVLIEAPFDGEALLTVANNQILETRNISVSKKGTKVKLNFDENWGTGAYCMISAFRPLGDNDSDKNKPFLPKRAVGIAWIGLTKETNSLKIDFTLPPEVRSKQTLEIPIQVSPGNKGDKLSKNTFVTVAAVDEGILKLTEFKTPNPHDYFYDKQFLGVELRDLYGKLIEPIPGPDGKLKFGGDGGALARNLQALSKKSFKIVSIYSGIVPIDKNGKGTLKLDIPEYNGTLRLMAVALDENKLGSQESSLLVRDPVVIEGVMPRFLRMGDQSTLTLTFINVKAEPGEYKVQLKSEGSVTASDKNEFTIELGKEAEASLSIPVSANALGDGKIEAILTGNNLSLSQTIEISVIPKSGNSNQSFNKFLKANESSEINSDILKDYIPGTEAITLTWSKQVKMDTTGMLKNLIQYPYGCVEQTTSKSLGLLAGADCNNTCVQDKTCENPCAAVNQALAMLSEKQNADGSFSLWFDATGGGDVWLTAYVVDFLQRAESAKFAVPKFTLDKSLEWLSAFILRQSPNDDKTPLDGIAYALYDLTKANRVENGSIRYFYDTYYDKIKSPFSRALVGASLAQKGDLKRAIDAFQNVYVFPDGDMKSAPYGTPLRDKAGVIALMGESIVMMPTLSQLTDTISSLLQTVGDETKDPSRLSTQEEVWLLLAAHNLLPSKSQAPINIMIDQRNLTKNGESMSVDLSRLELQTPVVIQNKGSDTLWQNVFVSGVLKDAKPAVSEGLTVQREYYDFEGNILKPDNFYQGSEVVVVVSGKSQDSAPHQLLIADFLPAGFEISNTRLNQGMENSLFNWLGDLSKPQYVEPRDDRFVASLLLDENINTFKVAYVVRAVTVGKYVHPGVLVEDMYAPKVYARTGEDSIEVTKPK